jgi:hypothetical protein
MLQRFAKVPETISSFWQSFNKLFHYAKFNMKGWQQLLLTLQQQKYRNSLWFLAPSLSLGTPNVNAFCFPSDRSLKSATQTQHTFCGALDLTRSPSFTQK